jgi:EmrB/QacA subfamily drug resistance transporter
MTAASDLPAANGGAAGAKSAWDIARIDLPHRERLEILAVVLLGMFLSALDNTIVGTALPTIVTELSGNDVYIWPFTAYLLTATISGPIWGKTSDIFGRRPIFLLGVSIFLIGSALCGLSQEMWQFILFRGLQGLGAGALFPVSLAIIGDIFPPSERGKYQGFFGAMFGVAFLIGPAIGGLITDNISWHWIFFVNIPLGLIVLFVIWRTLPGLHDESNKPSIDYLGAALLVATLVPILIGFTNKQFGEWTDLDVGGLILIGLAVIPVFLFVEWRAKDPLVPLHMFRIPAFRASVVAFFLAAVGFFAAVVFLPRWFQVVLGSSATQSGYQILPLVGGLIVAAITSGQIVARTGIYKPIIVGALLLMGGGLFLMSNIRPDTPLPILWVEMFLTGLGVGPAFAIFTLVVQSSVPMRELGAGTSSLTLFQQVGGTVGLAITGSIFGSILIDEIPGQMVAAGVPQEFVNQFPINQGALNQLTGVGDLGAAILAQVPPQFQDQVAPLIPAIVEGIHTAFSIATGATFVLGIVTAVVAAVVVLIGMPGGKMRELAEERAAKYGESAEPGEAVPSISM